MEINKETLEMLDLMLQPAFLAQNGVIRHINPAAAYLPLAEGQPVLPLLLNAQEDYADFSDFLQLRLQLDRQTLDATVLRRDYGEVFILQLPAAATFQILSLASMQLREPLAGLTAITERLLPDAQSAYAAQANRRIHQLMRILSNMSDVHRFANPESCRMEYTEVCGFLEEILEKADALLENIHIRIQHRLPNTPIYTLLDREQFERAVYNLLSNAAKFSYAAAPIQVVLTHKGQRLHLSVTSRTEGAAAGDYYDRFMREPTLEDPAQGIGLGLVLVRCAATNHGGAMLIDRPDPQHTRITMTFAIRQSRECTVRSPAFRIDYAGERDHGLFELSDVLPAELYRHDK